MFSNKFHATFYRHHFCFLFPRSRKFFFFHCRRSRSSVIYNTWKVILILYSECNCFKYITKYQTNTAKMKSEHIYGLIVLTLFTSLDIASPCEYLLIIIIVIDETKIFIYVMEFDINECLFCLLKTIRYILYCKVSLPIKWYIKCIKYLTIYSFYDNGHLDNLF